MCLVLCLIGLCAIFYIIGCPILGTILLAGVIIGAILFFSAINGDEEFKKGEQEKKEQEKKAVERHLQIQSENKNNREIKYGNCSFEDRIVFSNDIIFFEVYENVSVLVLGMNLHETIELNFKDIISAEILESGRVVNSTSTSLGNIKSNTGSMVGRAVVGGAIAGGVGAIIGGTTGNKSTNTYCNTETHEIVNYKLSITMNDLKNPIVTIDFNNQGVNFMQKLYSVLQVIINRNKEQSVLPK